jgi:IS1 family transposase/transposase-like protein
MVSARGPPIGTQMAQGGRAASLSLHQNQFLTNSERSLYITPMMNATQTAKTMACEGCKVVCQRFGKHRNGLLRFRCPRCKKTYTEAHMRTLDSMYISQEKAMLALQLLIEGNSLRSTQRITRLDINTLMSLLIRAGERCQKLMDSQMRGLTCRRLQCDEIWTYVGKKNRHVRKGDAVEVGDQWIFVALDADTKLVPCYEIGKRTKETTHAFLYSLKEKLTEERFQITTDGYHFYRAIQGIFGGQADFAQLVKLFGDYGQHDSADARYSPPRISEVISKVIDGRPDPDHISTSYVERQNLTMRMQMRRLTRLTNAFSKKVENLRAAVALHFAYYNFCRVHKSLRVTPAMEAGLTDHVWTIPELIANQN